MLRFLREKKHCIQKLLVLIKSIEKLRGKSQIENVHKNGFFWGEKRTQKRVSGYILDINKQHRSYNSLSGRSTEGKRGLKNRGRKFTFLENGTHPLNVFPTFPSHPAPERGPRKTGWYKGSTWLWC